ncbi:lipoyl(octanoyl) transferase LipB [Thermobaculum terrenum]|nr:lipoyl(octanoyl) transferase LipB [Thermobaculum terrenum]
MITPVPPTHSYKHSLDRRPVKVLRMGIVPYMEAWELQKSLVASIASNEHPESLILLQHPHTYTIGRKGGHDHLLASIEQLRAMNVEVIETDRGGDITYHGPEQIVGYPLINLRNIGSDVHKYLRMLEEVLIRTLNDYGFSAHRDEQYTGVWIGKAKIAAIGVKISRGITMHGFAININTDLRYFDMIIPCGITGRSVTSLQVLLGRTIPLEEVMDHIEHHFSEVFEVQITR